MVRSNLVRVPMMDGTMMAVLLCFVPTSEAKAYNKNTLHYCSSSFRESRQKRRAKKRPATVRGSETVQPWKS